MSLPEAETSSSELAPAWREFIVSWADDEILTAHVLGELLGGWSEVEDLIALASIAQDELAQARQLYALLEPDPREVDRMFYERPPRQFRNARLTGLVTEDWGVIVARQYFYELADRLRTEQLLESSPPPALSDYAHTAQAEERAHQAHWQRWCQTLANTPQGRQHLRAGVALAWSEAGDLLCVPAACGELNWPQQRLLNQWTRQAGEFLAGLGLETPAPPRVPARPRSGEQTTELTEMLRRSRRVYALNTHATWG